MIKRVKLFINENEISKATSIFIKELLIKNGFIIDEENYDLVIAVGGDGTFLRMVKANNFNSDIYYVGVNTGTLGFLQEVKVGEIEEFVSELKQGLYKIDEIGVQETIVNHNDESSIFYSLNEIVIRDADLKAINLNIKVDDDLLEKFTGDGILVATSIGSTAYNLSLGGSIVYNTFSSLQITPIAPINSKVYRTLINSVIIPDMKEIEIIPSKENKMLVIVDGENMFYENISCIKTKITDKKLKFLRLSRYNFSQKINEKLLNK